MVVFFYGRGERTQTFDLPVPNRARYQLRHTPMRARNIIAYFYSDWNTGLCYSKET